MDLLAQMTTFVRVVEAGSLSAAARGLRLSLPAVSRQITALEASVGAALFLRTARRVVVTERGQRYYERCLRVLREVDAAQGSVRNDDGVAGLLTVSAPVTLGLARVAPHVPALLVKHPGLRIDLHFEDRLVDIVGEGVDVAIRGGAPTGESSMLIERRITEFGRVVVASPRYLKRRGEPKTPDALARHDALVHLGATGPDVVWRFTRDGRETAVEVAAMLRTNTIFALRDAAIADLGVVRLPRWLVADDVASGRLRVILGAFAIAPVVVRAVYRTDLRASRRVKALVDHLIAVERARDP